MRVFFLGTKHEISEILKSYCYTYFALTLYGIINAIQTNYQRKQEKCFIERMWGQW